MTENAVFLIFALLFVAAFGFAVLFGRKGWWWMLVAVPVVTLLSAVGAMGWVVSEPEGWGIVIWIVLVYATGSILIGHVSGAVIGLLWRWWAKPDMAAE